MTSAVRMATLRKKRKEEGLSPATIWLTPEDRSFLDDLIKSKNLKSQSDGISLAIKNLARENTMTT